MVSTTNGDIVPEKESGDDRTKTTNNGTKLSLVKERSLSVEGTDELAQQTNGSLNSSGPSTDGDADWNVSAEGPSSNQIENKEHEQPFQHHDEQGGANPPVVPDTNNGTKLLDELAQNNGNSNAAGTLSEDHQQPFQRREIVPVINELQGGGSNTFSGTVKSSLRRSSMELRRLPVDILIGQETSLFDEISVDGEGRNNGRGENGARRGFLQKTCLNSRYTLRTQMMLSFGTISFFTILMVVIICIVIAATAGGQIKTKTRESFNNLADTIEGKTVRYIADDITPKLVLDDVVQILYEAARDRFAGYPIFSDDSQVPFIDVYSQSGKYPVIGEPMPLDWQVVDNVNDSNYKEHVQHRWPWYADYPKVSTASAAFYMQGACDPSETDPNGHGYFENCTEANNDINTGGVFAPSPTTSMVHRRLSDLNPIVKALYEYHLDVIYIGYYFSNSGAGASLSYPGAQRPASNSYTSIGCDWVSEPNPLDNSKPILSQDELERCRWGGKRVAGAAIPSKLYTPLDRSWCRHQALNPGKMFIDGPFRDAFGGVLVMTAGRSVYDRVTNEFIGCIAVDYTLDTMAEILVNSKPTPNSHITVTRLDEQGTVLSSSAADSSTAEESVPVTELGLGITEGVYKELRDLVDFSTVWDPDFVRHTYESFSFDSDGFSVKGYPIPPPPEEYDADYEPTYLVLVSLSREDVFYLVDDVDEVVSDRVTQLIILSIAVGCIGFAIIVVVLFLVSHYITLPLKRMNDVASRIINSFGGEENKIVVEDEISDSRCCLQTELTEIVKQFQKMVSKFSGEAIAREAKFQIFEVDNQFQLFEDFQDLYCSRERESFKYKIVEPAADDSPNRTNASSEELLRVHLGSNVLEESASLARFSVTTAEIKKSLDARGCASPLFRWIVVLIVVPLLLSTVAISAYVTVEVSQELPDMVKDAEQGLTDLQAFALGKFVKLRAGFVARSTEQSIRDLHLLTRYTSWLLFGGVLLSDAFPEMLSGTEACKNFPPSSVIHECPYAEQNFVCDCQWNDRKAECSNYTTDTRYMQQPVWFSSSQDVTGNGDRCCTTFPKLAYSPGSTAWFENATVVPGYNHSLPSNSSVAGYRSTFGYATTYDRLRTIAALPVHQLLYNYDVKKETVLATYVGFEADGTWEGYEGCSSMIHAGAASWNSTDENRAYQLRPELCPRGKFGFDPRCREWYDTGKKLAENNQSWLYVTSPYKFAFLETVAQSCTSPLINPNNNEYVGQTLVDFVSRRVFDSLDPKNTRLGHGGFPVLIRLQDDSSKADTVIGPNFSTTDESVPIEELILPPDGTCNDDGCRKFLGILSSMRAGEHNTTMYELASHDGSSETMHIAYAPVIVRSLRPLNSSDFSRGVNVSKLTIYSLALTEPESAMLAPFEKTENEIKREIQIAVIILCIVIVFAAHVVVYLSHRIAVSMTEPMYYLLDIVRQINRLDREEVAPWVPVHHGYGSKEVVNVQWTMEKLYQIIRCANSAYFAGEVEMALAGFSEALALFTRLDNKKAMGVASNNLGNTMLTLFRTVKATGQKTVCGLGKREIIGKGMGYFHMAIQLGEKAYDDFYGREGWSPACLNFMQHLSNRYFNRAMFLLTVKSDHEKPKEIEELGMRDLRIARDMDVEIVNEGTQVGWDIFRSASAHFEVLLCRIRGHLTLLEMGYPDELDVEEMLDDAFELIQKELDGDTQELFAELSPAGRLQQVEAELMRYNMLKGDVSTAAKIAIRMLVEDEFTLPEAQKRAVEVLRRYIESESPTDEALKQRLDDYHKWLHEASEELQTARSSLPDRDQLLHVMSIRMPGRESWVCAEELNTQESTISLSQQRLSLCGDTTMESF